MAETLRDKQEADARKRKRLTDKLARELPPPESASVIYFDAPDSKGRDWTPGFGLRVTANGARSFILNYRVRKTGRERRLTIGSMPVWSVEAAREEAKDLRFRIDRGEDPLKQVQAAREAAKMGDLCDEFLAKHVPRKRPSTQRDYRAMIENDIRPALGRTHVASVDFADIERLHRKISERAPRRANLVVAVLSKMFSLAMHWKMRPESAGNPCRGIERNHETKRRRYITGDELRRLMTALDEHGGQAADVFRLLLLTGARRGEVLSARWEQFDLDAGSWKKPASSTKQNEPHDVPLNAPALGLLRRIRKSATGGSEFVFPSESGTGHLTEVKKAWATICRNADISELRIHDLRHSYASTLASTGHSLPLIGALLGHSNASTTQRYAHLFDAAQRRATEKAGALLSGIARKRPPKRKGAALRVVR
jgi:integrase